MNRLFRPRGIAGIALRAALAAGGIAAFSSTAAANVEIGGTAGIHVFSETNELGVPDIMDAPSERNSALFGLRLGVYFGSTIGVEGEFGVVPSEARGNVFDIWNLTYRGHLIAQVGSVLGRFEFCDYTESAIWFYIAWDKFRRHVSPIG